MKRRKFIKYGSSIAVGIGVFGSINYAKGGFVGDTPTTSDILGPFYRPGAPSRQNLNPQDFKGDVLHLRGSVFKEDGKTPMPNCIIELWQCLPDGNYDNVSADYLYRANQKVGKDGKYHFITTKPIPEPIPESSGLFRPAHIHLRISAIGEQDLITQIYFVGDPYLESDPSIKSELAVNRILSINQKNNESEIRFDIVLKKQSLPSDELLKKVSGVYKMNNNSIMEFYRDGDLLFYKTNSQIWGGLSYAGDSTFVGGAHDTEAIFEQLADGNANVKFRFIRRKKLELEGSKYLLYNK